MYRWLRVLVRPKRKLFFIKDHIPANEYLLGAWIITELTMMRGVIPLKDTLLSSVFQLEQLQGAKKGSKSFQKP